MAFSTSRGKLFNSGELKQIETFLQSYLPKYIAVELVKLLTCCRPVIDTIKVVCVGAGLYDVTITVAEPVLNYQRGMLSVKGSDEWLFPQDGNQSEATWTNVPLTAGPTDFELVILSVLGDKKGTVILSEAVAVEVPACP